MMASKHKEGTQDRRKTVRVRNIVFSCQQLGMKHPYIYGVCLSLALNACDKHREGGVNEPSPLFPPPIEVTLNVNAGYRVNKVTGDSIGPIINSVGDTLRTGLRIPVTGRVVDSTVSLNPTVIAVNNPEIVPYVRNSSPVPEDLTVIDVDSSKLTKVELGHGDSLYVLKNSFGVVPTGVPIKIKGTIVPCRQPDPVNALPPRYEGLTRLDIQHLDMDQGLGYSYVTSAIEDRDGNLWFGTAGYGVSKYDGVQFTHYTMKEGLSGDLVKSICMDSRGDLWFGTEDGGLCKYDGHRFIHFTEREGLSGNTLWGIIEDSDLNYWIVSRSAGISKLELTADGVSGTITHYTVQEGLPTNSLRMGLRDNKGNIWISSNKGLIKFDGKYLTFLSQKDGLTSDDVWSIHEDSSGNFWFATLSGLNKYDGHTITQITKKDGLHDNVIAAIKEDKRGNIWFGTGMNSITKYDGHSFTVITAEEGYTGGLVYMIYEDTAGSLWFCAWGGGVFRFRENGFCEIRDKEGLLSTGSNGTLTADSGGNFWLTRGNTVIKFDGERFYHLFRDLGLGLVNCSLVDRSDNLWFGTRAGNGLFRYDGNKITKYTTKEGLLSNVVSGIMLDRDGNLWLTHSNVRADQKVGVTCFQPPESGDLGHFTYLTKQNGFFQTELYTPFQDSRGDIWFCSRGEGLCRYEPPLNGETGYFTYYSEKEGLSSNFVNSIIEDHTGDLWLTSGWGDAGVTKLEYHQKGLKRFLHYTKSQGITDDYVYSACMDEHDNLWFGSDKGLTLFAVPPKKEFVTSERAYTIRNLQYLDGLKGLEFDHSAVSNENKIWWRWGNGVTMLDANQWVIDNKVPRVQLNRVKIKGQSFDFNNLADSTKSKMEFTGVAPFHNFPLNLELPYKLNHLTFEFSAIEWSAPHHIYYTYRLLGQDIQWSNPSRETSADYRNLSHGSYVFEVRATGQSGTWSEPLRYSFVVWPPWWQTWWAYVLYVMVISSMMAGFIQWRHRKLIKDKRILDAEVRVRTRELNQSLDDLKSTQTQLIHSEKMASLGELTAGIAHEIQNPLNFVNNFSEVSNELLDEIEDALETGNMNQANETVQVVKQNLEKILQHGKRADGIVKAMLQHSRGSSGHRELININDLCDEYLRLAFHGYRAKDKSFSAKIETNLDSTVPRINVMPQEIGRVILNLLNNAFFAVSTKAATVADGGYQPRVIVSTKNLVSKVEINIADNGNGIPESVQDKIFQPFFTTKSTGQGTGLGLSLSYDIVKAHNGKMAMKSSVGEGTEFIVELPT